MDGLVYLLDAIGRGMKAQDEAIEALTRRVIELEPDKEPEGS